MRSIGWGLGLIALLAAMAVAIVDVDWRSLASVRPWPALAVAALVLVNLWASTLLYGLVTRCFAPDPPVPWGVMFWLISASSLLNYLPAKAGLFGRAAYLAARHGLGARASTLVVLTVLFVSGMVIGAIGGMGMLLPSTLWPAASITAVVGLTLFLYLVRKRLVTRPDPGVLLWTPIKAVDVSAAAMRLWLVMEMLGRPIPYTQALVLTAAGLAMMWVGLTPNGLGLREWAMGLVARAVEPGLWADVLAAAVLDRAIEAVVFLVTGMLAITRLRPGAAAAGGSAAGGSDGSRSGEQSGQGSKDAKRM